MHNCAPEQYLFGVVSIFLPHLTCLHLALLHLTCVHPLRRLFFDAPSSPTQAEVEDRKRKGEEKVSHIRSVLTVMEQRGDRRKQSILDKERSHETLQAQAEEKRERKAMVEQTERDMRVQSYSNHIAFS